MKFIHEYIIFRNINDISMYLFLFRTYFKRTVRRIIETISIVLNSLSIFFDERKADFLLLLPNSRERNDFPLNPKRRVIPRE